MAGKVYNNFLNVSLIFLSASGICCAWVTQSTSYLFKLESEWNEAIYWRRPGVGCLYRV